MTTESDTIRRLIRDLGLPALDPYTQDWAYELEEAYRTEAYFQKYLAAYGSPSYGPPEKHLLMQLMLDIANNSMEENYELGVAMWSSLAPILRRDHVLHADWLENWACVDLPLEDSFILTSFVRDLRDELRASSNTP